PRQLIYTLFPYTTIFRSNNVTQIVLAKGRDSRLSEWLGRSLAAELLRQARGVAIHVITDGVDLEEKTLREPRLRLTGGWRGYARSEEHTSELQSRETLVC